MDFTWLTKLEWKVFNVMKQEGPTKLIQANHITCCGPGSPNSSSFQRMHLKTKSWWYAAGKLDQHEHFAVQFMATAWTTYMHGQICSWYITKRLLVFFFFFSSTAKRHHSWPTVPYFEGKVINWTNFLVTMLLNIPEPAREVGQLTS